jgi:hypothetical protein
VENDRSFLRTIILENDHPWERSFFRTTVLKNNHSQSETWEQKNLRTVSVVCEKRSFVTNLQTITKWLLFVENDRSFLRTIILENDHPWEWSFLRTTVLKNNHSQSETWEQKNLRTWEQSQSFVKNDRLWQTIVRDEPSFATNRRSWQTKEAERCCSLLFHILI